MKGFKKKFPFLYYLVGGQVRDQLLGLPSKDFDFIVIGSTPQELQSYGLIQVGKSFPVFLDPETQDEYALARKEIPTGNKHQDFSCIFDSSITLEDDLVRRDFTINAICMDEQGRLIDLFHGVKDCELKVLRHISEHFKDDPLRVFRAAKFAARLEFDIAPETYNLMKHMVKQGALKFLSAERIKIEFEGALQSKHFEIFVKVLDDLGCWHDYSNDFPQVVELNTINNLEHQWIYSGAMAYPLLDSSQVKIKEAKISEWKNKYKLNNFIENLTQRLRYFIYLVEHKLFNDSKALVMVSYFQDGKNLKAISEFSDLIQSIHPVYDVKKEWRYFQKLLQHFKAMDLGHENLSAAAVHAKRVERLSTFLA